MKTSKVTALLAAVFVAALLSAAPLAIGLAQPGESGQPGQPGETPTATGAASQPAEPAVKKPLPPGFEPVPGGEKRAETVNANVLLVASYATFFLLMFGYVIYVVRNQTRISKEMAELAAKLDKVQKR